MSTERCFAATIGVFDGVHQGHRYLIGNLKKEAAHRGLKTMVITFARHPRQVLCPDWHPQLLCTAEEKMALLQQSGADRIEVLPFDAAMARLSAHDFMQQVLRDRLGVRLLLTGYDNHFGHRTKGAAHEEGFDDYHRYGQELGIEVVGALPLSQDGLRFSSSLVRRLLAEEGDVATATRCLGRHYSLSGSVVHGEQIGRHLGFPTANVQPAADSKLIPKDGVYAVMVTIAGAGGRPLRGMMNIGRRPTFNGQQTTLEVNLLDFSGDLYGHRLTIAFVARLRSERHFDSTEALVGQMRADKQQVEQIFTETT